MKHSRFINNIFRSERTLRRSTLIAGCLLLSTALSLMDAAAVGTNPPVRVLLLSIDGMHAVDLARYTKYKTN